MGRKIRMSVSLDLVGCKREKVIDLSEIEEEGEPLSDSEISDIVVGESARMVELDWEFVEEGS